MLPRPTRALTGLPRAPDSGRRCLWIREPGHRPQPGPARRGHPACAHPVPQRLHVALCPSESVGAGAPGGARAAGDAWGALNRYDCKVHTIRDGRGDCTGQEGGVQGTVVPLILSVGEA